MAAQQTIHYQISGPGDLDRLLDDISELEPVLIIVALEGSRDFTVTDLQLARLVAAARTHRKQLVVESNVREYAHRALLLGFQESAIVSDAGNSPASKTNVIRPLIASRNASDQPGSGFETTSSLATYRPAPGQKQATFSWRGSVQPSHSGTQTGTVHIVDANWSTGRFRNTAGAGSNPRPGVSPDPAPTVAMPAQDESRRRPTPVDVPTDQPERATEGKHRPSARKRRRRRDRRTFVLATAIIAPLLVIAVVGAIAAYVLPTATVTVVPIERPVTSTLTYGVAIDDASYDITIDPEPFSSSSVADAQIEATGERFEPDGTAGGLIQITNPLTSDVTIPAGTELPGANGVTYYTAEDVVIPAADPFGSLAFGSETVAVYAGIAGPDGNSDPGTVTGQLGNGLFFTNHEPIAGGTLRSIQVITEEDLERVRDEVVAELIEQAERDYMASVPLGMKVIPGSVEIGEPEIEVEGEAGSDGDMVSASGQITVRAQLFDPEELHRQASEEADRLLARQGGGDRILLAETVDVHEPTALNPEETAFKIDVAAVSRERFTESEREQLIQDLVGKSQEDAEAILERHPKIQSYSVSIEPEWLLNRLPEISSRIEVHISSEEQTAANR